MYLAFYDENNIFLTPEVTEEVRSEAHALKRILEPKFNNFIPEQDYALFSSGKSELPQSMATQFEDYLNFILNKVNNWEAYRNAYSYRRLAIIDYEEGEPTPIWFCIPINPTETMEVYTPPATEPDLQEVVVPTISEEALSYDFSPSSETQPDIGNFTLNQAIELIKQRVEATQQKERLAPELARLESQLQDLDKQIKEIEAKKLAVQQSIEELKQIEVPDSEEVQAIMELAYSFKPFFTQR